MDTRRESPRTSLRPPERRRPRGASIPFLRSSCRCEPLRGESSHDARGRLTRERALDEAGAVVKDDLVFEDGSRQAFAK